MLVKTLETTPYFLNWFKDALQSRLIILYYY